MSAWVVPLLALSEARVDTPVQDPAPLPYLAMKQPWGLDVDLSVQWNGDEVSRPPYREMYWSPAQMLAHLTVNGAPVGGERRTFLEDGDEVVITASAPGPHGRRIGFGEARGRVQPAPNQG